MSNSWTKEQSDAIFGKGGSILVSAAAGSGKTAVLVQRIIEMISNESNNINIDEILVVTFSNASSNEMKQRILNSINKLINDNPSNLHLIKQRQLLPNAKISTIHSFCLDIIRENFNILGLSPDLRISDDLKIENMKLNCIRDIIEQEYRKADKEFLDLVELISIKDDKNVEVTIVNLHKFIENIPFVDKWIFDKLSMYKDLEDISSTLWARNIYDYALEVFCFVKNLLEYAIDIMKEDDIISKAYMPAFLSDLENIKILTQYTLDKNWDGIYNLLNKDLFVKLGIIRKYDDIVKKQELKQIRDNVKSFINDLKQNFFSCNEQEFLDDIKYLCPIIEKLLNIVKVCYYNFNLKKIENNILSFSDLERMAFSLLIDSNYNKTKYADRMSNKYKEILIDEYQDTNEIQDIIFKCISKDERNLFMVGDVKQSIYKFRNAMPEIFIDKSSIYNVYNGIYFPAKIILDKNFRSRRCVTEFINHTFETIMSKELGEIDYDDSQKLVSTREFCHIDGVNPEIHLINSAEYNGKDKIRLEAAYIARKIRTMIDQKYMVDDSGIKRECTENDFCILLRSLDKNEDIYIKELNKLGIQSSSSNESNYLKTKEITLIINILKILDNPLQDIPLLSVLASKIFDIDIDDITNIRLNDGSKYLYYSLLDNLDCNFKIKQFIGIINELSKYSSISCISDLVQRIYDTLDIIPIFRVMEYGEKRVENLYLFLNYIRNYDKTNYSTLSEFINFIDNCIQNDINFKMGTKKIENTAGVKIISIHRSKGLEFPICILAGCSKKFNFSDLYPQVVYHNDLGCGLQIRDKKKFVSYYTVPYQSIRLKSRKELLSEEMRILYVAMSRAKEKLIFTMTSKNFDKKINMINLISKNKSSKISPFFISKLNNYADWILLAFINHTCMNKIKNLFNIKDYEMDTDIDLDIDVFYINNFVLYDDDKSIEIQRNSKSNDNILNYLDESLNYKYPHILSCNIPIKMSVTSLSKKKNKDKIKINKAPTFMLKNNITPAEKGSILHKFMQFADFSKAKQDLDKEIKRLVDLKYISKEKALTLNKYKINKFLSSKLVDKILFAKSVKREVKFRFKVSYNDIDKSYDSFDQIVVQGIVDCLIFDENGIIIVDYKTDFAKSENDLISVYKQQLLFYKKAVEQTFDMPVLKCVIYSLYLSKEIDLLL